MKLPQTPPVLESYLAQLDSDQALDKLEKIFSASLGPYDSKGRYLHWDKLRHLIPPEGYDSELFWLSIKQARTQLSKALSFKDKSGKAFLFCMPTGVVRDLLWIEKNSTGAIVVDEQITDEKTKQTYLIGSLIEEAISSSQLEGASTTRRQAKEMLRSGREPQDHSEKMIRNNHNAMLFIREYKEEKLTPSVVFELHRILTEGTLDPEDTDKAGIFRAGSDDICVFSKDDVLLHVPPKASELPDRLQLLCDFANQKDEMDSPDYIPTVIRAIVVHFMIGYDHPFVDGNGRTARALFYWMMAKDHYWLMEYISISRAIKKAPAKYMQAYLNSETDANDVTYFIIHQLEVIREAINDLHEYLKHRSQRLQEASALIGNSPLQKVLNHRQLALLQHALRRPGAEYTVKSHQGSHGVSYQTARSDLLKLSDGLHLLRKVKVGKKDAFIAPLDLAERVKKGSSIN